MHPWRTPPKNGTSVQFRGDAGRAAPPNGSSKATLVISIDFELYWGVYDLYTVAEVRERTLATRSAISRILRLFGDHGVHATWATVGFLFARNYDELQAALPTIRPQYSQPGLSPYERLPEMGSAEEHDPLRSAPSVIEAIRRTPHQEIGSHTFSHFYCLEEGQTEAAFRSDLEAAILTARKWNIDLRSLIFPRNQVNENYLQTVRDLGFTSYRGAGSHWIYTQRRRCDESLLRRAMRLLDVYFNLSGHHSYSPAQVSRHPLINLPASRMLRSYSKPLCFLEPLRIRRICSELRHAADRGEIYHLWFHPEELALNQDENIAALRKIVEQFAALRDAGRMQTFNMDELSTYVESMVPPGGYRAPILAVVGRQT